MGVDIKILNKLDKNNVCIEVNSEKNNKTKYYRVPQKNVNIFIDEYKKNDKKTSIIANTAFVSSVFAGVILTSLATKKLKNNIVKWLIGTAGGIVGATLSIIGMSEYIDKNKNKLLEAYDAQEINYTA